VKLYQWDERDPELKTWMKAFPGTVEPKADIPQSLLPHLRYPQDMFKVQRDMLGMYHMTDATAFFNGTDIWQVPADPATDTGEVQPPYYLTVRMPDQQQASFSLTSSFVPAGRDNLAAFMAVDADPGPDYGKIRILKVPTGAGALGPKLTQAKLNSDQAVANQLTLLKTGSDSDIEYGNLLTLPVGGGFLNVEPVYLVGRSAKVPVLQKVLAVYGNNVALEDNLANALAKVLGSAASGTPATPVEPTAPTTPGTAPTPPPSTGGGGNPALDKALQDAQKAFTDGQDALKNGDWTRYGQDQKALQDALNAAAAAQQKGGGATPAPSSAPTPSSSPAPSSTPAPSASPTASP
jgi:uncharacterized membrane protein (UPF0182 family)